MKEDFARVQVVLDYLESLGEAEIERLDIEIKSFEPLDAKTPYGAQVAKAIMALANHGGGILIIGYKRDGGVYIEQEPTEAPMETWEKTRLHDLLKRFMSPVVEVDLFLANGKDFTHPAIVVPSHGRTPIICTRDSKHTRVGAIYIRKPGPKSEEPSNALEWSLLLRRCLLADRDELALMFRTILEPTGVETVPEEGEDSFHDLISRADNRFEELCSQSDSNITKRKFGRWTIAHQLVPAPDGKSLSELHSILERSEGRETGWPIGIIMTKDDLRPHPRGDILEAWILTEQARIVSEKLYPSLDYWFAKPNGFFYATRAFYEDLELEVDKPMLEWFIPIWRMGEGILHAIRAAKAYETSVNHIRLYARYQGLAGRVLWNSRPSVVRPSRNYECRVDVWTKEIIIPSDLSVEALPDVVEQLLAPFYEQFDLFKMPTPVYAREITRMVK